MGAVRTRGLFLTTPLGNTCGGVLSFWVNFRERFQRDITSISKLFRSINSLLLWSVDAVSTLTLHFKSFTALSSSLLEYQLNEGLFGNVRISFGE